MEKLPLYRALKKYGLNNFVYVVLQYCEMNVDTCVGIEQHYIDLYKPKYNILKLAVCSQDFKHLPDIITKLKIFFTDNLHPRFRKEVSTQQKYLTSIALKIKIFS